MNHGQPENVNFERNYESEHSELPTTAQPQAAGELATYDQKVTWLELFFDLIFVTSFDQLAKRLGDTVSGENILIFLVMFLALWSVWSGNTLYSARFGNETRIYRWGTIFELFTLGALSLALRGDLDHVGWLFAGAYAVNRFTLATMHMLGGRLTPETRDYARVTALGLAASGLLWLLSIPLDGVARLATWGVALGITVLTPVLARRYHGSITPHHDHLPERVGLLQIIALGGIFTEVVGGGRKQEMTLAAQLPSVLALVTTVALFRLYFDQSRTLPVIVANLHDRGSTLMTWLYAHTPLTIAIMMVGVGFGHGIAYEDAHHDQQNLALVAWPMAVTFLSLAFIRWNSVRFTRFQVLDRSMGALLLGAAASVALAFSHLDTLALHAAVAAVTVLAAFATATDPASRRLGELEEKVVEDRLGEDGEGQEKEQKS
ncbi:low temperature requirement protein A [Deinococcus lacus]|uniref:Low temperature requirement protein A n=1 Tax=Deinococcus lacus TaxID=392561 RepID=A0ABW1YBM2_9DEIO